MYIAFFSDQFKKNLQKLTKRNAKLKHRIEAEVTDMLNDPFRRSIPLSGKGEGKLRIRFGDYRFIYAVCHDCREKGHTELNSCIGCNDRPDNSIVYFDVQLRSHAYDKF